MFTGIIQELGKVKDIRRVKNVHRLALTAGGLAGNARIRDSVSVDGACLTLVKRSGDELVFEIMKESLKTKLGRLRAGDNVNLEVELIAPIAMEKGVRFAIREGGRTVGAGTVTDIIE